MIRHVYRAPPIVDEDFNPVCDGCGAEDEDGKWSGPRLVTTEGHEIVWCPYCGTGFRKPRKTLQN